MAEGQNNKISLRTKIPTINELEDRFLFITDDILRQNIAVAFQYLIFLIAILDELEADNTTVSSSIHKDMILYTGSIIECLLHYCLKQYIEKDLVKSSEVMPTHEDTKEHKLIFKISDTEKIISAIEYKKTEHLTTQTNFIVVNRACKRAGILTKALFDDVEKVRELRNKIHLSGLRLVDNAYSKDDSQKVFDVARKITERVELKLKSI